MKRSELLKIRSMIEKASVSLADNDALEAVELFPAWQEGMSYVAGQRVRYDEKLYRVVQPHVSQADWLPPDTPALYTDIAEPGTIPVWRQPTGAQDAYMIGDMVHYPTIDDPVYVSTIDNNVWSPEEYPQGWEVVEE